MKTFATRSESVIETYRRDLEEFRSGLKKETELFREAASRAVKEIPASIEVGASVAQGMIKSTADIISQGTETLLTQSDSDLDASDINNSSNRSLDSRRYSRFDAQLRSIQSDVNTFGEEPEDLDDYNKWKVGFMLDEKNEEIENLVEENGDLERIYKRVVPNDVDQETFWCRYFYRVHKLKQQADMRANIVKRAIAIDDEEELSWDVDDDDEEVEVEEEEEDIKKKNVVLSGNEDDELSNKYSPRIVKEESSRAVGEGNKEKSNPTTVDEDNVVEQSTEKVSNEKVKSEGTSTGVSNEGSGLKSDDTVDSEGKAYHGESCKESDISVGSTQTSSREEELEWDEIEDLGSNDEKKVSHGESPDKAYLRKGPSAAEEDEDLSWDIEDDDEPVKADVK